MKNYLVLMVLFFAAAGHGSGQAAAEPETPVEKVQNVVGTLIGKPIKAAVLLTDLNVSEGYVTALDEDDFDLSTDKRGGGAIKVRYADVLAISSKTASVSLVPDPAAKPFGEWRNIRRLWPNISIEVTDNTGKIIRGRYRSATEDNLTMIEHDSDREVLLKRPEVAFVFRVKYGARNVGGSVAGGTERGAGIGKKVGDAIPGIRGPISGSTGSGGYGGGIGTAMGAGIGAAVGAIKGGASKSDALRVLIFSQ